MRDPREHAAEQATAPTAATATPDPPPASESPPDILSAQCAYLLPSLATHLGRFHARPASSSPSSSSSPPPFHLLDIGCGSGKLTRAFAAHFAAAGFPAARVTGVDVSAAVLVSARAQAEAEGFGPNVRFLRADVVGPRGRGDDGLGGGAEGIGGAGAGKGLLRGLLFRGTGRGGGSPLRRRRRRGRAGRGGEAEGEEEEAGGLPFEESRFDVVHCHQVLAHVSRPADAIAEMIRVVKKRRTGPAPSSPSPDATDFHPGHHVDPSRSGGLLCLREGDLTTVRVTPASPLLEECFGVIRAAHRSQGGEPAAGRHLAEWAREAISRGHRGAAGRRGKEEGKKKKKGKNAESSPTAAMAMPSEERSTAPTVTAARTLWRGGATRADREAYGSHWPGRCRQGMFFEAAAAMGVPSGRMEEYALAWRGWIEDPMARIEMVHAEVLIEF